MERKRILIVEDEARVAEALCRALTLPQGGGHQVESCDSGEAALARLQQFQPDLIIADLRMSGMSGLDLLEYAHRVSPNTRSLLITAFGDPEIESRVMHIANGYLPKPFSLQNFMRAVQAALSAPPIAARPDGDLSDDCVQALAKRLEVLRGDTGGLCLVLSDWAGHLVAECGQRSGFDIDVLIALLGNSMAAATEVARQLNEVNGFDLHYHEGRLFEVYAAMVSQTMFMALLVDRRAGGNRIGLVSLYMRRAIEDMRHLLAQTDAHRSSAPDVRSTLADAIGDALDQAFNLTPGQPLHDAARPPGYPSGVNVRVATGRG